MKYKIKTKKGNEGILEANTQVLVMEQARQFCQSHGEGWPGAVEIWERLEEEPKQKSGGKK